MEKEIIKAIPNEYSELLNNSLGLINSDSKIEDQTFYLGRRPWVAPKNYSIMLYPPIRSKHIAKYEKQCKIDIPKGYKSFLEEINGAFIYGISLFGIPQSMIGFFPHLRRDILQCHDIGIANNFWKHEYQHLSHHEFYIGSRNHSFSENVGFFWDKDSQIIKIRKQDGNLVP